MNANILNYVIVNSPPNEIIANAIHIDTVKISHYYRAADLPPPEYFERRGFDLGFKSRNGNNIMTARLPSLKSDPNEPKILIIKSEFGYSGVNAEVSLAKIIDGIGLGICTQADIECALDGIEDFIREKVGVSFNARTAKVSRFDANADFMVGEDLIHSYINAISRPYARLDKRTAGSTTLYYLNRSRAFAIYGKKEEMKGLYRQKKVTWADVEKADGLLRIEARLLTPQANKRFAEKLTLPAIAGELLTMNTATRFVADTLELLSLDKPKIANKDKEMSFKKAFGFYAPEMLGILIYRKYYGEDFWKILGWSQSTYDKKKRKLKDANLWDISPSSQALPALLIKPN